MVDAVRAEAGTRSARHPDLLRHRSEFPLLERSTYLNTCSLGALSGRSRARLDRFLGQWDELGARAWYRHWLDELQGLRDDFGWAVGRPGDEIALAPNVSVGLATIASALDPIHRGDADALVRLREAGLPVGGHARPRVITTALDFPTVGHQWLARAPLGVEVVVLPSADGLTVPLEAFEEAIDERTALVATAQVYFTTGAIQDVGALAAIAHERGALLLVDAYQATGLVPAHLERGLPEASPEMLVSGSLKWLFGGPGSAFVWVRPELHERPAADDERLVRERAPVRVRRAAPRLRAGRSRLRAGDAVCAERRHRPRRNRDRPRDRGRADARTDHRPRRAGDPAGRRGRARGARGPRRRAGAGGIVPIAVREPKRIVDALAERRIIVDYRPGIVRLSPAFYNTDDEVAEAIDAIATWSVADRNCLQRNRRRHRPRGVTPPWGDNRTGASDRTQRVAGTPAGRRAERLFELYALGRVRGYVAFRVRGPADVEDLTAEVFRRLVSGPDPARARSAAGVAVPGRAQRRRGPLPPAALPGSARPAARPTRRRARPCADRASVTSRSARPRGRPADASPAASARPSTCATTKGCPTTRSRPSLGVPESTARSLVYRGLKRVAAELDRTEVR